MKQFGRLLFLLFVAIVLASLYGILHDQLTFTISEEYFTRFKFIQFHIAEAIPTRLKVTIVGFAATWWTGVFIGFGLWMAAFGIKDKTIRRRGLTRAFSLVFSITVLAGFFGFLYGKLFLAKTRVNWPLPDGLSDKASFIVVGSIHNFSYLGGLLGTILGIFYLLRIKNNHKKQSN